MTDRPLDEVYDTMMDVERNPMGAWEALQKLAEDADTLRAEVVRLRSALEWTRVQGLDQ
tara:strand:+ start:887 stop:1063 length:177 start_codon:yes stop_codon:yes gene_type:complete